MKKLAVLACLSALLLLLSAASAFAATGTPSGTFRDFTTGAPIAGGSVTVSDEAGRPVASAASDAQGRFLASADLLVGRTYTARYTAAGYQGDASTVTLTSAALALEPQLAPVGLTTAVHFSARNAMRAVQTAAGLTPPSTIRVYRAALNRVDVVDFKTYCKHVLPKEWIASWPTESLRAGAVAVKEYAWYWVSKGGKWTTLGADVKDNTSDQVYDPAVSAASTDAAVDSTWDYYLLKDGALFQLQYCSGKVSPCQGLDGANRCITHPTRTCQWGSKYLADAGWDWQRILRWYTDGVEVSPHAAYVKYTNAVAYELKSLLVTHFYTSVDTPNMRAKLYVKTAEGNKVIFDGTIAKANETFWFPAWNGKGIGGKTLPSATYEWVLLLWKDGSTATSYSGKISVSRIVFTMAGTSKNGAANVTNAYGVPGNANCYLSAVSPVADALSVSVTGPSSYRFAGNPYAMGAGTPMSRAVYMSGSSALKARGTYAWRVSGKSNVTYRVTVIQ